MKFCSGWFFLFSRPNTKKNWRGHHIFPARLRSWGKNIDFLLSENEVTQQFSLLRIQDCCCRSPINMKYIVVVVNVKQMRGWIMITSICETHKTEAISAASLAFCAKQDLYVSCSFFAKRGFLTLLMSIIPA